MSAGAARPVGPEGAPAIAPDPATGLPRLPLARLPTPLEGAPRLAAALGLRALFVKREDLSGYALGGNKLRKLDYILADALRAGADTLIGTAGAQSNFCRALAAAAAKTGLGCRLHLRAQARPPLQGNLLLDHLFGAQVTFTSRTDPWDPAIADELGGIAE
ncbi:MAG TPA: pyridoxal-phosphate dependent enzyme, partial [Beijerinckiaceae bacterium]|nr:pyridoxal-phosphate dependent enzyme [Beijerinckiaceae bacterium]